MPFRNTNFQLNYAREVRSTSLGDVILHLLTSGHNSNNEMWFQEMDRTNPLDTTKSEERPEGSLNADTLAEVQVDNSLNTEVGSQSPEVANQSPEVANMFNLEGTSCSEEPRTKHVKSSTIRT